MVYISVEKNDGINPTYTFHISVDYIVSMQVTKAAGDTDQLQSSELKVLFPMRRTYQIQTIDSWVLCNIPLQVSVWHPLRDHRAFE